MKILFAITLVLLSLSDVSAKCTRPKGLYSGNITGTWYDTDTRTEIRRVSLILTVKFAPDGSAYVNEMGKRWGVNGTGIWTGAWTVPAIGSSGHSFNITSCQGKITASNGLEWVYVATNSGATLTGVYFGDDSTFFSSNLLLNKI